MDMSKVSNNLAAPGGIGMSVGDPPPVLRAAPSPRLTVPAAVPIPDHAAAPAPAPAFAALCCATTPGLALASTLPFSPPDHAPAPLPSLAAPAVRPIVCVGVGWGREDAEGVKAGLGVWACGGGD